PIGSTLAPLGRATGRARAPLMPGTVTQPAGRRGVSSAPPIITSIGGCQKGSLDKVGFAGLEVLPARPSALQHLALGARPRGGSAVRRHAAQHALPPAAAPAAAPARWPRHLHGHGEFGNGGRLGSER
ncbi:unnamed protein product, partial [Prorocentrum cordatum]